MKYTYFKIEDTCILIEQIAWIGKGEKDGKPTLQFYLKGNNAEFVTLFKNEAIRDYAYNEMLEAVKSYYKSEEKQIDMDKACDWLKHHINDHEACGGGVYEEETIEDFKKAMEEKK